MKKLLLIALCLNGFEVLSCCPWLNKAKTLLKKPASGIELEPVRPEISPELVTAAAATGLEQHQTFEFTFKTGSGPETNKSITLYPLITRREFKERIIKACGYADYTNQGYIISIYNAAPISMVTVYGGGDKLLGSADLNKILSFKDPLVVAQQI